MLMPTDARPVDGDAVTIRCGALTACICGNEGFGEHRPGYNGLASLQHEAQPTNLFVPTYAGLNFEHIFDGERGDFQPRSGPYTLLRFSDTGVGLHRSAESAEHWGLESLTRYTLREPHYVDFELDCVPHAVEPYKHGFIGVFWASYISAPDDKCIYFLGRERGATGSPRWVKAFSPAHGVRAAHLHERDAADTFFTDDFRLTLANHYSDFTFSYPFYFGRSGKLVWIMMFDLESLRPNQSVRFAQSPTGGGARNPAWDFYFLIRDFKVGERYRFRCRTVCKEYVSPEDVVREYEHWSGASVGPLPSAFPQFGTPRTGAGEE